MAHLYPRLDLFAGQRVHEGLRAEPDGIARRQAGFGPCSLDQAPHLSQLHRNQLAEQGAYVNTGEEVAVRSRTLRRRRVVAVLRVIERDLHELGDRNRPSITDAREELSALLDEVQNSGRPIAITRHGKPVAVLMNMEALEQKLAIHEKRPWKLRGSGTWEGDAAEIESAIRSIRQQAHEASDKRIRKIKRGLSGK